MHTHNPKTLAVEYLARNAADLDKVTAQRIHYVKLARQKGLTHQQIADPLGITEAAVRQMLKRHGGA